MLTILTGQTLCTVHDVAQPPRRGVKYNVTLLFVQHGVHCAHYNGRVAQGCHNLEKEQCAHTISSNNLQWLTLSPIRTSRQFPLDFSTCIPTSAIEEHDLASRCKSKRQRSKSKMRT
eukprot:2551456-Amphidinium_carterae.1